MREEEKEAKKLKFYLLLNTNGTRIGLEGGFREMPTEHAVDITYVVVKPSLKAVMRA